MRMRSRSQFWSLFRLGILAWVLTMASRADALDPSRSLTQYFHRIWQVQQGLLQGTVYSIEQTRDGNLWLGTQTGLVRFDGLRFTSLDRVGDVSLENIWVRSLFEGSDGAMWVATIGTGLIRVQGDSVRSYRVEQGMPSDNVRCVVPGTAGEFWVATEEGLARLNQGKISVYRVEQGLATNNVRALCRTGDGTLWIGGDGTRLTLWNGSTFVSHQLGSMPPNSTVRALLCAEDGTIWVGTSNGLVRIKDGTEKLFTIKNGLADNWILHLDRGSDGSLWVGTKNGFSRVRNDEIESFRTSDGLSQSSVYAMCEDREGSLWVGTKYGLNQFLDRRIIPFTVSEGLPSNDTGPVFQDRFGNIWVGTLGAGLSRFDGRRFSAPLTTEQGLASNVVNALGDGEASDLWIGTDKGLNRLRGGRVEQTYTSAQGLPSDSIHCVLRGRHGELWVGTSAGPALLRGDRFVALNGPAGPIRSSVLAMIERRDGTLLFATADDGIYTTRDGKLTELDPGEGIPQRDVTSFYEDQEGVLWMGTIGGGLRVMQGNKVTRFLVRDGLFDDDIYGIIADSKDRLWMACSKGVFWASRSDLLKFAAGQIKNFTCTPFSPTDAQRTIECEANVQPGAWTMRDGRLWFSTIHGVIVLDPSQLAPKLPPAPVVVEEVTVNGQAEDPSRIEALPPGLKNLEFQYTCLSFVTPLRIMFRYKLNGFDRDWIEAGTRREAFYTNLPPGRYWFQVKALNVDGNWSEAAAPVEFVLTPHFYQRPWFLPMCGVAACVAAWVAYRLRVRAIRSHLDAIVTERSRIARELHDTLLQGFSGVTMEMQALSMRLTAAEERTTLGDIIRDAGNCMREARRSVAGLRTPRGANSGFACALEQTARQLVETKEMRLALHIEKSPPPLGAEGEYNLLRIAQEAIANSIKHSGARTIEVFLDSSPERMRLRIRDDGSGFDDPDVNGPRAGHYGLIGIKERATQIGAVLRLDAAPGRGTEVEVLLPLTKSGLATAAERRRPVTVPGDGA